MASGDLYEDSSEEEWFEVDAAVASVCTAGVGALSRIKYLKKMTNFLVPDLDPTD